MSVRDLAVIVAIFWNRVCAYQISECEGFGTYVTYVRDLAVIASNGWN